jgi:acyl-CoA reductase-like NAD-dependent aldehyde dehydrogenase
MGGSNPFEKQRILEKAVTWVEQNEADLADIIIEELGGTRLKAMIEIYLAKTFIKEASSYPLRNPALYGGRQGKPPLPGSRRSRSCDQPL